MNCPVDSAHPMRFVYERSPEGLISRIYCNKCGDLYDRCENAGSTGFVRCVLVNEHEGTCQDMKDWEDMKNA